MEFEIEFYVSANGSAPVKEWLDGLKMRSPNLQALVVAGINRLKSRANHVAPLSLHVDGDVFELRVGARDTARVLYFFVSGRRIVLLHGFVKKTQSLPRRHLNTAQDRLTDYRRRHPDA